MSKKEYMTTEERRAYNKQYYEKNREKVLKQVLAKDKCENCGKMVAHQNMKDHRKTAYCFKHGSEKSISDQLTELKKMVEEIKLTKTT